MEQFKKIFDLPFIQGIIAIGGEVFIVGGTVRDYFLGKEPKDVDFIVRNIPIDELMVYLQQYWPGKVDLVGESFGVIKYTYRGEIYDIALPRTDSKLDGQKGHKSILSQVDHTLPIEADLLRRDITINSIAINQNLELVDPFNGIQDLKNKVIRATSPESFIEDPLRMMRAIGMATRFGFDIEPITFGLILFNNHLIKSITGERILDEITKVFDKNADLVIYSHWLKETGLWHQFFKQNIGRVHRGDKLIRLSELLFIFGDFEMSGDDFVKTLKITNELKNDINALYLFYQGTPVADKMLMFNSFKKTDILLKSSLTSYTPKHIEIKELFENGIYPKSFKELALQGEDFLELGLIGPDIGDAQIKCLESIFSFKTKNTKEDLLSLFK